MTNSKVVIPAEAGIQADIISQDFWILNQVEVVLDTGFRRYGSWE